MFPFPSPLERGTFEESDDDLKIRTTTVWFGRSENTDLLPRKAAGKR